MLDRTIQPQISDISGLVVPSVSHETLPNGMLLHSFCTGTMPLIDIAFLVHAGKMDQNLPFLNSYTADLLKAGTKGKNANEVAEILDFYGAVILSFPYMNRTIIRISAMANNVEKIIELLRDCIFYPDFDESELQRKKRISRTSLERDLRKTSFLAARENDRLLYGNEAASKLENKPEHCDIPTREDLKQYHSRMFYPENIEMFLGGNYSEDVKRLIVDTFASVPASGKKRNESPKLMLCQNEPCRSVVKLKESVQSTVRMSMIADRNNGSEQFMLETFAYLLGGTLTSRLSVIREEYGYTYGINSYTLIKCGYNNLVISSDCDNKYAKPLIDEVYRQLERVLTEPISEEELHKAKNQCVGSLLQYHSVQTSWMEALLARAESYPDAPRDFDFLLEYERMMHSLTVDETNAYCKSILDNYKFYEIVAGLPTGM